MSDAFKPLLARLADGATLSEEDAETFFAACLRGEPSPAQIAAAALLRAPVVELHTGAYAEASGTARDAELARLVEAARLASDSGIQVNAGHGLNYGNVAPILSLPKLVELNIGHSIVSRAVFVGLEQATREMVTLLQ